MQTVEHVSVTLPLADFKQLLTDIVRTEIKASRAFAPKVESDNLLTIKEVCVVLGVSRPTVYAMMKEGKIRYLYLAKNRLRFNRLHLLEDVAGSVVDSSK